MQVPIIRGIIDRRVLVNFRVEASALGRLLPAPFRPKLVGGMGMAGVCLIRLKHIRPRHVPSRLGISSENAAHRVAVVWESDGETREGVFIPRRDTSSWLNTLVGGRLFPGVHHHALFRVQEGDGRYRIEVNSDDARTHLLVEGHLASEFPAGSVFGSLEEASGFFERGSLGYSATARPGQFDGLELRSLDWHVQPLAVDMLESSFFEDRGVFPTGSAQLDCALLMHGIEHEWRGRKRLCSGPRQDSCPGAPGLALARLCRPDFSPAQTDCQCEPPSP
ncbi:MAG TPA: DUF2071 domain-containing protein [Pirellulales bacterium]|nr:DUF2071 domain-containing protein [Pirellulales bacterium]